MMKRLLAVFVLALPLASPAVAETQPDAQASGWTGAVGAGPIVFPHYSGGKATQAWLIPLISAEYKDILYIEPLRAGVYFWGSEDRKMGLGLAIEPRFGYKAGDGARLAGMSTRGKSIEGGPAFDWDLGFVSLSASLFTDLTNSSRGESARLYAYRQIVKNETWKIGAFVGIDRMSHRVSNYFFGVNELEASPDRPAFHTGSATNATAGFDGRYRLDKDYSVLFGLQQTRLGHEVAHSPIVETRQATVAWLGLAWNL